MLVPDIEVGRLLLINCWNYTTTKHVFTELPHFSLPPVPRTHYKLAHVVANLSCGVVVSLTKLEQHGGLAT